MSEEWCREQLEKLQIKDKRLVTLTEIRDCLSSLPANELAVTSNFLQIPEIFKCVEDSPATEQTNLACDILSLCMANLDIDPSKNKYYIESYIQHPNDEVKYVGLSHIERILETESPNSAVVDANMIIGLINCLECESTRVGTSAMKILSKMLPKALMDASIRANLENLLKKGDVVKCRVYEICVDISKQSIVDMNKVEKILLQLILDIDNEDVLVQLNILELLSELASTEHGIVFLDNNRVFSKITKNVDTLKDHPLKSLIVPGYMKFFGSVSRVQPAKIIQGYPNMINALFDCILDSDCSILPIAFDTLGQLAVTNEGKILLHTSYTSKLHETLSEIGKSIHNLTTALQVRALKCLETMFISTEEANNQVSTITKTWFDWLTGTNGLAFLMDFCRNPFPEIKIGSLTLTRAICMNSWGQQALDETAGFIEFLLDRRTDFSKDAILEKYSLIQVLAESMVFSSTVRGQLQKYVKEGAFYVESVMDVAIEGT